MALAAEQPAIFSFLSSCQVGNHFPKSGVKIHLLKPPPKFWFSWEVKSHCFQSLVSLALLLGRTNGFLRYGGIKHSKSWVANNWHSRTSHDCWQTLEKHTNAIQALGKLSQINISRLCWYLFGGTIHCCGTNDIPRLGFSVTLMACSIFSAAARGTATDSVSQLNLRRLDGNWAYHLGYMHHGMPGTEFETQLQLWLPSLFLSLSHLCGFGAISLASFFWPKIFPWHLNFLPSLILRKGIHFPEKSHPQKQDTCSCPYTLENERLEAKNHPFTKKENDDLPFQTSITPFLCSMLIFRGVPPFPTARCCVFFFPSGDGALDLFHLVPRRKVAKGGDHK